MVIERFCDVFRSAEWQVRRHQNSLALQKSAFVFGSIGRQSVTHLQPAENDEQKRHWSVWRFFVVTSFFPEWRIKLLPRRFCKVIRHFGKRTVHFDSVSGKFEKHFEDFDSQPGFVVVGERSRRKWFKIDAIFVGLAILGTPTSIRVRSFDFSRFLGVTGDTKRVTCPNQITMWRRYSAEAVQQKRTQEWALQGPSRCHGNKLVHTFKKPVLIWNAIRFTESIFRLVRNHNHKCKQLTDFTFCKRIFS